MPFIKRPASDQSDAGRCFLSFKLYLCVADSGIRFRKCC